MKNMIIKQNVLIVLGTPAESFGSVELGFINLSKYLKDQGHEVFFVFSTPGIVSDKLEEIGVRVYFINLNNKIRAIIELRKLIKKNNIALIHLNFQNSIRLGAISAIFNKKCKVIAHIHTLTEGNKILFLKKLVRNLFYNYVCDSIVVVSNAIREQLKYQGINDSKLIVIYNCIDTEKFRKTNDYILSIYEEFLISKERKIITYVAGYRKEKNHELLINVFEEFLKYDKNWHLLLVGYGPLEKQILKIVKDKQLLDTVTLTGRRYDIPNILSQSDLYISTSKREGFGLAICEAMSTGLCVISTEVGGVKEIILDGVDGFLVANQTKQNILQVLLKIYKDPKCIDLIGARARKKIEDNFSISNWQENVNNLYYKIIQNR